MGLFDFFNPNPSQKAIDTQVQKEVNKQINAYTRSIYRWFGNDQPIALDTDGESFIKHGYQNVGAVFSGTSLILNKLSACPVLVYQVKDTQLIKKYDNLIQSGTIENKTAAMLLKSRVLDENSHPDIQKVIDTPNETQSINDLIEEMAGSLILQGDTYIYRNGADPANNKFNELFTLPAQETTIISGGIYNPVKGYRVSYSEDIIPAHQVIHAKTYNPDWSTSGAQLYGQSAFRAILDTALSRSNYGNKEVNKQLKNGGTLGVVSPKNVADYWNKEQGDSFKERLRIAKSSTEEDARVVAGAVPLDFLRIGLTIADMELLALLKLTDEQIYRALHIPLQYLNQEASTYNNKSEAGKELVYNALDPVAQRISKALTRALCDPVFARTGKRFVIKLDTSSLPEMAADMKEIAEWLDKSWDLTPNEKREVKGWGKSPNPAMDQVYIPGTYKLIDDVMMGEVDFSNAFNRTEETDKDKS